MTEPADRPEAERLDADACIDIAAEIIDDRDATIARLQQERDDYKAESEMHIGAVSKITEERDAATREAEALREEVGRLRSEGKRLAMPRRERVPFVLDEEEAPTPPSRCRDAVGKRN